MKAWLLLIMVPAIAAASGIRIDPVSITVLDAETGEPIEGAIVAVTYPVFVQDGWNFHQGAWYEQSGDLHPGETTTSATGRASFEALYVDSPSGDTFIRTHVPMLLVYKEGYQPLFLAEDQRPEDYEYVMEMPERISSSFDGSPVHLLPEPPDGLTGMNVGQAMMFMTDMSLRTACEWTKFPQLLARLEAAAQTRPRLAKRLRFATSDSRCTSALRWAGEPGARELHIDVDELAADRGGTAPPVPEDGRIMIIATGETAYGYIFIQPSGQEETLRMRFHDKRATLGPIRVTEGEEFSADFFNQSPAMIRQGTIDLEAIEAGQ